ncbi:hypothetical protein CBL_05660 [Carabus blaptoides fortunei]
MSVANPHQRKWFLALFQKNQSQLENVKKNYEICVQQQESLSTQLQVIVDYKTKLEKSLQSEKADHKQTRTELEARINDEKTRRDKTSMEVNLRLSSLQQHYKLLQTKHDDLKEKSDKSQQQYLDETDRLQAKVKALQEELKQSEKNKEKSLEHLKSMYMQLEIDKDSLAEQLKKSQLDHSKWENDINHLTKINHQLQRELEAHKTIRAADEAIKPEETNNVEDGKWTQTTTRKFARQVELSDDLYQIRDQDNKPLEEKRDGDVHQVDAPQIANNFEPQNNDQNVVLQKPSNPAKSTTKTSAVSKGNLGNAAPLSQPTLIPSNVREENMIDENANNVLAIPNIVSHKKIPPGVVPVPKRELQKQDDQLPGKLEDKILISDDINNALPNRYRINIIESGLANEIIKEAKVESKQVANMQNEPENNMGGEANQQDNAANEVIDQPKNLAQDDPLHLMANEAGDTNDVRMQELEPPLKDSVVNLINRRIKKQHIDALRAADRGNADTGALRAPPGGAAYEGEGDYDKEGQKEDLQIEEAEPEGEEDDDPDDYDGNLAARQKDPAVRN